MKNDNNMWQDSCPEAYYALPVINWKEILGDNRGAYIRRPRTMQSTLKLKSAAVWIERLLGIPIDKIEFVGVPREDWEAKNIKDLQPPRSCLEESNEKHSTTRNESGAHDWH